MTSDRDTQTNDALDDAAMRQSLEDVVQHRQRRQRDTRHITAIATAATLVMVIMIVFS